MRFLVPAICFFLCGCGDADPVDPVLAQLSDNYGLNEDEIVALIELDDLIFSRTKTRFKSVEPKKIGVHYLATEGQKGHRTFFGNLNNTTSMIGFLVDPVVRVRRTVAKSASVFFLNLEPEQPLIPTQIEKQVSEAAGRKIDMEPLPDSVPAKYCSLFCSKDVLERSILIALYRPTETTRSRRYEEVVCANFALLAYSGVNLQAGLEVDSIMRVVTQESRAGSFQKYFLKTRYAVLIGFLVSFEGTDFVSREELLSAALQSRAMRGSWFANPSEQSQ